MGAVGSKDSGNVECQSCINNCPVLGGLWNKVNDILFQKSFVISFKYI
jgi:hypothetical protein